MTIEDIRLEEGVLNLLKERLKQVKFPSRTISRQFATMQYGNRNTTQRVIAVKKEQKQVREKIATSERKIFSFREALLGVKE